MVKQVQPYAQLVSERKARENDKQVQASMGLKLIGLHYEAYSRGPLNLYVACDGVEYVKLFPGKYVRRDMMRDSAVFADAILDVL